MMNEHNLIFTISPLFKKGKHDAFNVHVEDRTDLNIYKFANIIMPDNIVTEYALFECADLERLKELCSIYVDQLLCEAKQRGTCFSSEA